MERRDSIVLVKICSEINLACDMMGNCTFEQFNENEMLRRAVCMTVINIGELVKNLTELFGYSIRIFRGKQLPVFGI